MNRVLYTISILICGTVHALAQSTYKMTTAIPPGITTPASVNTRIGTLEFFDGVPTEETAQKAYDQLDYSRGIEAFLNGVPGASMYALKLGCKSIGAIDGTIAICSDLMDSRSLFLTANTESIYYQTWIDLKNGPIVVESPPEVLGVVNDAWFRYVTDLGNAGPDKGKGGKYLILPPGYKGAVPAGYFVYKSPTYGNIVIGRGFMKNGSPKFASETIKKMMRVYPLSEAGKPHPEKFVESSGKEINTIHSNDFNFYRELNEVVQEEPEDSYGPDMMGIFNAIGIVKGKPFAPDERMKQILTDAVATGNAIARSIDFRNRNPEAAIYLGKHWNTPFIGGSYEWLTKGGARNFDARTMFFYVATVNTPAMAVAMPGVGSQYASANLDAAGAPFDGGKTYRLHVPAKVPVKDFWSVVLYDVQTRSMLQTDQQFPSLSSQSGPDVNADGSTDVYFSPVRPDNTKNWIQTIPNKSWFTIFRLYGPLQPWFDKSWELPDIEEIRK
ncbi:DUF1254 domain-containing protein [Chitinophaga sp. Cy-1792]|uniref:DUF1254 domain-containing protein n=1 Tax=Chitinophaga sp. Cy-1792 TaxID=2608339 RepID=UPI001423159D|nr:DUF1254 domain-containing protein [Chitinophaga sp. Cy-1792]NIG52985.1 DUF1254 domain-containing protein [Chitinophaga sp. Cy-1792]